MVRPNDSILSQEDYLRVRSEATRMLQESDTLGVFPTPIEQILATAKVEEVPDKILDASFLDTIRDKAHDALKKALDKVLGLYDAVSRLIFIDKAVYFVKQNFIRLHEAGHAYMPWQDQMYKVVEECKHTLSADVADQFDVEANVFASEVLFQNDTFISEANDHIFSISVPIKLSKKYGASIYASIRQYVYKNHHCCIVLVLDKPEFKNGFGFTANLRRIISSDPFSNQFSKQHWQEVFSPDDEIGKMVPIGGRKMSGKKSLSLTDDAGTLHEFTAEAFTNTYQVFILMHQNSALTATRIIMP